MYLGSMIISMQCRDIGSNLDDINDIYDYVCRLTQIRDCCHGCGVPNDTTNLRTIMDCGFKPVVVGFFRILFWASHW